MKRLNRRLRDESGMSYVFIGMGLMAFFSASMLAIDVGMLMTARNQAQNSADAGALAGAVALAFEDFNDRSPSGPAVTSAMTAARANAVMGGTGKDFVTPDDVEFLNDDSGNPTRVKVTVYRTETRSNPLSTLIAGIYNMPTAGVAATATAEVSPADAMTCVKPFSIPDKWIEKQDPGGWTQSSTFEAFTKQGVPLANPDIYIPAADCKGCPSNPGYTGYNAERERGQPLMIRAGQGNDIQPGIYFSIAIGGVTGGSMYEENIRNCNPTVMKWYDLLMTEPGGMMGPTIKGIQDLIDKDPGAYWNTTTNRVAGSAFPGQSPRVFPIPLYDPVYYDSGVRQGRTADLRVANWIGFFADYVQSNNIYGRIIPIAGIATGGTNTPDGLFPTAIRLVE